jgi:hypothetical protein
VRPRDRFRCSGSVRTSLFVPRGLCGVNRPIRDAELEGSTLKSRLGPALKKRKSAPADLRRMLMAAEAKTVKEWCFRHLPPISNTRARWVNASICPQRVDFPI